MFVFSRNILGMCHPVEGYLGVSLASCRQGEFGAYMILIFLNLLESKACFKENREVHSERGGSVSFVLGKKGR